MKIGEREIGRGAPGGVYVIAEIGVNHDGDAERALALVDAAADAGADAVKVQVFEAERLMSRAARLAVYQENAGERDPIEMLRRLELSLAAMARVAERAKRRGIHAIATVFSVELVEGAAGLGFDAFKSASPDIVNRPLLEAMAATERPLIVSTGASTLGEVERTAKWLAPIGDRLAMLQCVSAYPTPDEDAALGGVGAIAAATKLPVGYSDHTRGIETGAMAVAAGACILEKHLTYDRRAQGPDHAASLEGREMREYVQLARRAGALDGEALLRRGAPGIAATAQRVEKRVLEIERDVRLASRQSLVAKRSLRAGAALRREDLTIKRPGTGIEPWRMGEVIGRTLAADVDADMPLSDGDLR